MPRYLVYNTTTGQIDRSGEAPEETVILMLHSGGHEAYLLDVEANDATQYVDVGQTPPVVTDIPVAPSRYHEWDWYTHDWVANLDSAKEAVKGQVDALRSGRQQQPITYDDKLLDADSTAIVNLSGKLDELTARAALGLDISLKNLVWRDYNNVTHSWDAIADYKSWLEGLAIAIAERASTLYMIGWTLKDAINDLTTIEDVINYDIWQIWDESPDE